MPAQSNRTGQATPISLAPWGGCTLHYEFYGPGALVQSLERLFEKLDEGRPSL
jgi:hypothetical protein